MPRFQLVMMSSLQASLGDLPVLQAADEAIATISKAASSRQSGRGCRARWGGGSRAAIRWESLLPSRYKHAAIARKSLAVAVRVGTWR